MASVITSRRPQDPTRLEIEARKLQIRPESLAVIDNQLRDHEIFMAYCEIEGKRTGATTLDILRREMNRSLQEDDCEPLDLPSSGEPREMTKEDICNVDIGSLAELNRTLGSIPDSDEERWGFGDVDPATVDLDPDALADYRESIAKPLPLLKTETKGYKSATAWLKSQRRTEPLPKKPRDVRSFRSKRK